MRRHTLGRNRAILGWFAAGFVLVQLALAWQLETAWPGVRDPEWHLLMERLQQRRAEAPGRPLVVVLGSSRTQIGLGAAALSRAPAGPLVFNACVPGAGPLAQQALLDRLLLEVRLDRVAFEVMPPFFSQRGASLEESFLAAEQLTLSEVWRAIRQAREPGRVARRWLRGRLAPVVMHRAALQRYLLPEMFHCAEPLPWADRDGHGTKAAPTDCPQEKRDGLTRLMMAQYGPALRCPTLFEPRVQALEHLVQRCRQDGIDCVLFLPPESSFFHTRTETGLQAALQQLAARQNVPVHDGRAWLPDEDFIDGHHALLTGSERFTARFAREVLRPAALRDVRGPTAPGRRDGNRPPGS
jgi:hypothetical protein